MIEKPKILIVEDESIISMDLKMNLETMGYIVCGEIAYAEEVLEKVKATHPNIILMDITLKGKKSGIDTAKELYPTYDIPVIYISSEINHERLKNTKIPTTYGYLVKPIREDALYSTIEITMDKYRLQKEVERKNEQLERANEEYERANEELNETIKIVEKSKKTIQKSESKFKTLFHSIGDIAVVFDSENNVIEANDNACRKLGYNRNELLNMNLVDFQSSEDNKQIDYRKKHLADENRCYFEATLIGKQGKHIP